MKNFNILYDEEKTNFAESRRREVAKDKARLIEAMKEHFVIDSFADVNEQGRIYYKSLLESMWDPKTGINQKGIDFINEGKIVMTKETPKDQVKTFFQNSIKSDVDKIIACVLNGKECPVLSKAKEAVSVAKPKVAELKAWTEEMICAYMHKSLKI